MRDPVRIDIAGTPDEVTGSCLLALAVLDEDGRPAAEARLLTCWLSAGADGRDLGRTATQARAVRGTLLAQPLAGRMFTVLTDAEGGAALRISLGNIADTYAHAADPRTGLVFGTRRPLPLTVKP